MKATIIIPTLNEERYIERLLDELLTQKVQKDSILVVDGGSSDSTIQILMDYGVNYISTDPSRAHQLNLGAQIAKTDWLYFIHADTIPPKSWPDDLRFLDENKMEGGTYRAKFENGPFMLRLNAFFTRFNWLISRGGDQTLFIKRAVFEDLGGYDESMVVMEEYPLIERLYNRKKIHLFKSKTKICARKYSGRTWLRVSRANYVAFKMYKSGSDSRLIKKRYDELLG